MDFEFILSILFSLISILFVVYCIFRVISAGLRIIYVAITNNKLYRRWTKIQYIREKRQKELQENNYKKEIKNNIKQIENNIKQSNIKKFAIRRNPNLLEFCRFRKRLYKFIGKVILFVFKAIGILILIWLICHIWDLICSNPLYVIIVLLFLILIKK